MTTCSICGGYIYREANGWDGGHNAWPVTEGRCCGNCNYLVVIPTRIRMHEQQKSDSKRDVQNSQHT